MQGAVLSYFMDALGLMSNTYSRVSNAQRYLRTKNDFIEKRKGYYFITQELLKSFLGELETCTTKLVVDDAGLNTFLPDDIIVSGTVGLSKSTKISFQNALKKAMVLANAVYLPRVRFDHQPSMAEIGAPDIIDYYVWIEKNSDASTYLISDMDNWTYREDGEYWIFVIQESKAGGSSNGSDRFNDYALVRVDSEREACVVKSVPYAFNENTISEDEMICGNKIN